MSSRLAGIHPRTGPRSHTSHAEVDVYEALKRGLPAGWSAWHSLRLRIGGEYEGEGDFVVAAPDRGLLVIEVKGGRLELRDGKWFQNGESLPVAPRQQAQGFVRHLVEKIRDRHVQPPPFGVACAFPDIDFSEGPGASDVEGLVLGRRDLAWLEPVLPELLSRALPHRPPPMSRDWVRVLHELWGETWAPSLTLPDQALKASERILRLDAEQLFMLDMAEANRRAVVEGGAGTGKTIIARELCLRRARAGRRVRYFCYTQALAKAMDASFVSERAAGFDVLAAPIQAYARGLVGEAAGGTPTDAAFWKAVSLNAACEALPAVADRPDEIVIDEAQDLTDGDWMLVEALAGAAAGLWIFTDPRQRFWADRLLPPSLVGGIAQLRLVRPYRNPETIARFAALYTDGVQVGGTAVPDDPQALRLVVTTDKQLLPRLGHEVGELRRQGVSAVDIAVLSLMGQTRSRIATLDRLGTHRIVRADAVDAGGATIGDTFLRFKGLERPFVIVSELVEPATPDYDRRMHIALTRATACAVIVCTEATVAGDDRLRALRERLA